MSHFTCLVIGDNVDEQMAPYHEFECTGEDDQYVQDIDKTEKARAEYEKDTTMMVKSPSGKIQSKFTKKGAYKKHFLREPTEEEKKKNGGNFFGSGNNDRKLQWTSNDWKDGKGYRSQIVEMPKGWTEVEVKTSEYESFAAWIEGYYGHKPVKYGQKPNIKTTDKKGNVVKTIDDGIGIWSVAGGTVSSS